MTEIIQPLLFDLPHSQDTACSPAMNKALEVLASSGGIEARGAVFTRIEVVEFILDLIGYEASAPLYERSILEPSFGRGAFLLPIIDRLLFSYRGKNLDKESAAKELNGAIRAVELHRETYSATRKLVIRHLSANGFSQEDSLELADAWLVQGDFLLEEMSMEFNFVAGNPPYVRQELIPGPLLAEYRNRFKTIGHL